jgi:hypothetical protein
MKSLCSKFFTYSIKQLCSLCDSALSKIIWRSLFDGRKKWELSNYARFEPQHQARPCMKKLKDMVNMSTKLMICFKIDPALLWNSSDTNVPNGAKPRSAKCSLNNDFTALGCFVLF